MSAVSVGRYSDIGFVRSTFNRTLAGDALAHTEWKSRGYGVARPTPQRQWFMSKIGFVAPPHVTEIIGGAKPGPGLIADAITVEAGTVLDYGLAAASDAASVSVSGISGLSVVKVGNFWKLRSAAALTLANTRLYTLTATGTNGGTSTATGSLTVTAAAAKPGPTNPSIIVPAQPDGAIDQTMHPSVTAAAVSGANLTVTGAPGALHVVGTAPHQGGVTLFTVAATGANGGVTTSTWALSVADSSGGGDGDGGDPPIVVPVVLPKNIGFLLSDNGSAVTLKTLLPAAQAGETLPASVRVSSAVNGGAVAPVGTVPTPSAGTYTVSDGGHAVGDRIAYTVEFLDAAGTVIGTRIGSYLVSNGAPPFGAALPLQTATTREGTPREGLTLSFDLFVTAGLASRIADLTWLAQYRPVGGDWTWGLIEITKPGTLALRMTDRSAPIGQVRDYRLLGMRPGFSPVEIFVSRIAAS